MSSGRDATDAKLGMVFLHTSAPSRWTSPCCAFPSPASNSFASHRIASMRRKNSSTRRVPFQETSLATYLVGCARESGEVAVSLLLVFESCFRRLDLVARHAMPAPHPDCPPPT